MLTAGMSTEYLILSKARESGSNGRTMPFLLWPKSVTSCKEIDTLFPSASPLCDVEYDLPLDDPSIISPVRFACFSFNVSSDTIGCAFPNAAFGNVYLDKFNFIKTRFSVSPEKYLKHDIFNTNFIQYFSHTGNN